MELQTQLAKKAKSNNENSIFSSDSEDEDEDEEQSNQDNQALITYVQQKVAFAKLASKETTKRHKKK